MSATVDRQLGRLTLSLIGLGSAAALVGALVGSETLGLVVASYTPATAAEVGSIFARNAQIGAVLVAGAAMWQLRLPALTLRICDGALAVVAATNAIAIGVALGALGGPAIERTVAHAPAELGGFALFAWGYLRARRGPASALGLAGIFACGFAALAAGAAVESLISGEIR